MLDCTASRRFVLQMGDYWFLSRAGLELFTAGEISSDGAGSGYVEPEPVINLL